MATMKNFPTGAFAWCDLVTIDAAKSIEFYTELLSWQKLGEATPETGMYQMLSNKAGVATAIFPLCDDMKAANIPSHWSSYVLVDKLEETLEKVTAAGGTVTMPPMDVMTAGRMAKFVDPLGAHLSLWQAGDSHGMTPADNQAGSMCWNELIVKDTKTACDFYAKVFDWKISQFHESAAPGDYFGIQNKDRSNGGIMECNEATGEIPPHWNVYFAVEDCQASVAKAKELGATICKDATPIENVGTFAVIQDPQGAVFSIIQMNNAEAT